jgi:hypothetical protein
LLILAHASIYRALRILSRANIHRLLRILFIGGGLEIVFTSYAICNSIVIRIHVNVLQIYYK